MTGVVTVGGRPLNTGVIAFSPDENQGTNGPMGHSEIDAEGKFRIVTTDDSGNEVDGAIVGFHRVRIQAMAQMDPANPRPPESLVPLKVSDFKRSDLYYEVKADQENHFVIDLPAPDPSNS